MVKKLIVILVMTIPLAIQAQDASGKVIVTLKDGTEMIGDLTSETDSTITVRTPAGLEMTVPRGIVTSVENFSGRVEKGRILHADPNKSMYLFSPSAFPIGNNRKYCRDFCLFFPSINAGVGENLSFQGGIFWFPGLELKDVPIIGSGKLTFFQDDRTALAAGMMYIRFPSFDGDDNMGAGFLFATGTRGDGFDHISLSLGYGFVQYKGEWEFMNRPILALAGNKRLSNSIAFVTENWILPEAGIENVILSISSRFFGQRIAVDLGGIFTLESLKDMVIVPVLNFTYHFR